MTSQYLCHSVLVVPVLWLFWSKSQIQPSISCRMCVRNVSIFHVDTLAVVFRPTESKFKDDLDRRLETHGRTLSCRKKALDQQQEDALSRSRDSCRDVRLEKSWRMQQRAGCGAYACHTLATGNRKGSWQLRHWES